MKRPPALTQKCFHPTLLNKLIFDYEVDTVLVEGLSDIGTTRIDLRDLARHDIDADTFLAKLFDPDHVRIIQAFQDLYERHYGRFNDHRVEVIANE